jgi:cytochrome P450
MAAAAASLKAGQPNPDLFGAVPAGGRLSAFTDLARSGPVHRVEVPGLGAMWLVTGYAEVRQVLLDPRLAKAPHNIRALAERLRPDLAQAIFAHMLTTDGDEHARLRRLVGYAFTRRRTEALIPQVHRIADELLDALAATDPGEVVDLLETFAYPLPMNVIFELLGIPEERRPEFHHLFSTIIAAMFIPDEDFARALEEMVGLLRAVVSAKRADPGEDMMTALIAVRDEGDRLSDDELTSMAWILTVAGHETTANLIANGTRVLLTHPFQLARLRADPALMDTAIDELLRYDSPVQVGFPLLAREDVEVGGVRVRTGELVLPGLLAANHQPALAGEPAVLDLARDPNHHVAFGHGVHHCLGAMLARIEGRIALGGLIKQFPDLELAVPAGELMMRPNILVNQLTALPVRLGKAAP